MSYHLSAEAILYSVICMKRKGIYGVKNVLNAVKKEEYPLFVQNAEAELMDKGLGCMDFDGTFTLDTEFEQKLGFCADCDTVLSAALRCEGQTRIMTGYLGVGNPSTLEQVGENEYVLRTEDDVVNRVMEFLRLPEKNDGRNGEQNREQNSELAECCVDSALVQRRDRSGLIEAGCGEKLADLVIRSAKGIGGYAMISRVHARTQTDLVTVLYGPEGIVTVDVEYPAGREMFRLTPVRPESAAEMIGRLIEQ